jgi:hypothetical protein
MTQPAYPLPKIVAVEMGYGHLRAAHTLAEIFKTEVIRMDLPPVAGPFEKVLWCATLRFYNALSRACDWQIGGAAAKKILEQITQIPLLPTGGESQPVKFGVRLAAGLAGTVIGSRFRKMAFPA